jgi:phenylalanyl-tRNA synthetase beta chain
MIVSLKWLSKYVDLPMSHEELALRLSLSGLNHEETERIDDSVVIDLEVTSNRGDCLGHIGVAREIGVLYGLGVRKPAINLKTSKTTVDSLLTVENQFVEACPRYTARVIRGVKVGPSPEWLVEALRSVFWKRKIDGTIEHYQSVNNVVDATNFVLMECGQPLHAFDYSTIADSKIIVRAAKKGETIEAIDHGEYTLDDSMCVIADASGAEAVAGVMGGARSEVSESTTDLVIEAAIFTPLSVRRTARKLKLHSPSSYRFERKVDPQGVDWASRRVCEIITDIGGGEVAEGVIDTAPEPVSRQPIVLRASQLERILGIKIDTQEVARILSELGCRDADGAGKPMTTYVPPTWRHDLTREADLIEEVARIHGYDKIPEDAPIPVAPSAQRPFDVAMQRLRTVLATAGLSEAMTPSVVRAELDGSISPWTELPALETQTPMLKGARTLRRSLIPSLLEGRAKNWASASIEADLYEIAHIYLPSDSGASLPSEQYSLAIVCGNDFFVLKGVVESLCTAVGIATPLDAKRVDRKGLAKGGAVELRLGESVLGYLGIIEPKILKKQKLPQAAVAAEISLPVLLEQARLVPQQKAISMFPTIQRDLNFVVAESIAWREMEDVARAAVGTDLAGVTYRETYRDTDKDGAGRKRVLMTVELQRHDSTLSGDQADELVGKLIGACREKLSAELLQ